MLPITTPQSRAIISKQKIANGTGNRPKKFGSPFYWAQLMQASFDSFIVFVNFLYRSAALAPRSYAVCFIIYPFPFGITVTEMVLRNPNHVAL